MTCEQLHDQFELYALGVLEGEEKVEMDAHLSRHCPECEKNFHDALSVNALLIGLVGEVSPPARLKRRLMASLGVERAGWTWAAVLAAACMLAVALWLSVEERNRSAQLAQARVDLLQVRGERDRMLQALTFLNDPETRPVGFGKGQPAPPRGNVFVNPRTGVLLIASNLPRLGAGKTYEMWLIPKGGSPRPAGLFQSDAMGEAFHILSGPVDPSMLGAVAVTVEPDSGSPGTHVHADYRRESLSVLKRLLLPRGSVFPNTPLAFDRKDTAPCINRGLRKNQFDEGEVYFMDGSGPGGPIVIYPQPGENYYNACQDQLGDLYVLCGVFGDGSVLCCPAL